jgi:hypothetical protein
LFVLGTIFEETSSAPAKIEKKTFYRLSIGIWCLMVAILTNCYNGLMITGLNSPLPGSKIESFKDLLCDRSLFDAKQDFNITQWMDLSKKSSYWNQVDTYWENLSIISYESRDCFRIWSPASAGRALVDIKLPVNELFSQAYILTYTYRSSSKFKDIMELSEGGTKQELLPYSDKIMLSLLYPGHSREPEEISRIRSQENRYPTENELAVADETEITNCTQKSAYITDSDLTATELDFLSRNYAGKKKKGTRTISNG